MGDLWKGRLIFVCVGVGIWGSGGSVGTPIATILTFSIVIEYSEPIEIRYQNSIEIRYQYPIENDFLKYCLTYYLLLFKLYLDRSSIDL